MTFNITDSSAWEANVEAPSTTDPVNGGSSGTVVLGLQDLANRTKYLKDQDFTDRKNYVERISGNKCTLLKDDNGEEHLMYKLRKFNMSHLIGSATDDWHPAFYDSGTIDRNVIYVGVHIMNENADGDWVSDPGDLFAGTCYNFSSAKSAISSMGSGWHMMNIYEWSALVFESILTTQYLPGATYNDRFIQAHNASDDYFYRGQAFAYDVENLIYPGSGGSHFNHDQTQWGVADMVGNTISANAPQFLDLIKIVDGQIYLSSNRDNNFDEAEASWTATGIFIEKDGSGGLQLDKSSTLPTTGNSSNFSDIDITAALIGAGNSLVDSKLIVELLLSRKWNDSGTLTTIDYLSNIIGLREIDLEAGTKYICAGGRTIKDNTSTESPTNDAGLAAWEAVDSTTVGIARACYIEP